MTAEAAPVMEHDHPAALETLCKLFGLSPFERDVLLLCAGVELEATFAPLRATASGDPKRDYPTFSLALAALPEAHWSVLSPAAALRYWQLVQVEPGRALTRSPLHIDERVLNYLAGVHHLDERLAPLVRRLPAGETIVSSHEKLAREMAATWAQAAGKDKLPAFQLCGAEIEGKRDRNGVVLLKMPVESGRNPDRSEDRLGLQTGYWQYVRSNRIPRPARRSMLGVLAT